MAGCTNTTTLNITFTGVSGEVGAGTDAEGDIVAVGNAKGSLFGIDATVLGRYDSGDGATAAVRTDLLSAKGGLAMYGETPFQFKLICMGISRLLWDRQMADLLQL
jgi:hypothetical protein